MVDQRPSHLWGMRALYLALATFIIFLQLLPIQTTPRAWASADVLLALTFAWSMRRPEYVPALSIAGVMLLADLLFQRPPGLYSLLVLAGSQILRARAAGNRDMPYLVEWLTVAGVVTSVMIMNRIALTVFFLSKPSLSLSLIQLGMTIALYPVVVLLSHLLLGVRKSALGEVDALGHKL